MPFGVLVLFENGCCISANDQSLRALFNGVDRHYDAPFVRKRALLLWVRAFAPSLFVSLVDSPQIRFRGFIRAIFRFPVRYCENRSNPFKHQLESLQSIAISSTHSWNSNRFSTLNVAILLGRAAKARHPTSVVGRSALLAGGNRDETSRYLPHSLQFGE